MKPKSSYKTPYLFTALLLLLKSLKELLTALNIKNKKAVKNLKSLSDWLLASSVGICGILSLAHYTSFTLSFFSFLDSIILFSLCAAQFWLIYIPSILQLSAQISSRKSFSYMFSWPFQFLLNHLLLFVNFNYNTSKSLWKLPFESPFIWMRW